jgi:hypothetical protein
MFDVIPVNWRYSHRAAAFMVRETDADEKTLLRWVRIAVTMPTITAGGNQWAALFLDLPRHRIE